MLGLDNAGKTTLLYRLKIPGWKRDEMLKDLQRIHETKEMTYADLGYHYEEYSGKSTDWSYGIWDVPGGETMRQSWPAFYRYIKVSALIFVVSGAETSEDPETVERILEARKWLHHLLAEDELRNSYFALIINDKAEEGRKKLQPYDQVADPLRHLLGIDQILEEEHNRNRFKKYIWDISLIEGETSSLWSQLITDIDKYFISFGGV